MKILFLSDNFPPEVNAPASRTFEHVREWVKAGHDVTVITGAPNFPSGNLHAGYRNAWRTHETIDGVTVERVKTYMTANEGFARRILDYLSFSLTALMRGIRLPRADVIVATSPQFFTTFAGYALSKLRRVPWVFEVRDLWPASIEALGAMRHRRLLGWLERIELALYRDAALVIVVTEAFKADLVRRGIAAGKIRVVTNGVDLARYAPRPKDADLVQRLELRGKTVVGYIGTHGQAQGMEFIIDCAARVGDPAIHFLFVGAGAHRQLAIARAHDLGLTNTTFLESVPKDEVARYIATSDVILVPLRRMDLFTTVIPSKIFEAASMERPILLGVDGEARSILERFGAGRYYQPENSKDFLTSLAEITKGGEAHTRMVEGCRSLAAAYERPALAATMLTYLGETVARRGSPA